MGTLSPKLSQSLDARWRRGLAVLLWSAALLLGAGWGIAIRQDMDVVAIRWLTWGFGLFLASGAIWVAILIPIQIKQAGMTRRFARQFCLRSIFIGWYVSHHEGVKEKAR